jgi:two-component system cell cycle sensor histidine kinase/response regulator CckA
LGDGDTQQIRKGLLSGSTPARRGAAHLIVLEGGQVGRRYVVEDSVTIGRIESVSIQIDDPMASRRHSLIRSDGKEWRIVDLGSQNGTWVNAHRVEDQPLHFGDRIQVGETLFLFSHRDPLEERVRHRQKLETLGRLGAGVAHDINNLLGSILANADMVALIARETGVAAGVSAGVSAGAGAGVETVDPGAAERARSLAEMSECLEDIRTAAHRGADLTKRILDQARHGSSEDTTVDLSGVVHESVVLVRRTFDSSIQIEEHVVPGVMVRGNRSSLHQVVMNLLVNARDALPAGGHVEVRLGPADPATVMSAEVGGEVGFAGQHALLEVRDSGTGIPEAIQSRIFEPFFSTKPADRGSGLGLATVAEIVAEHGGRVSFDTKAERGTLFRVVLPALNTRNEKPPMLTPHIGITVPTPRKAVDGMILVVDDDPLVRRSLVRVLTRDGHKVADAESGRAALDLYGSLAGEIRLVLLDLDMPELDGEATFAELRRLDPAVRVLFLTGLCDETRRDALLGAGACGLLTKPCDSDVLRRVVRQESGVSPATKLPPRVL